MSNLKIDRQKCTLCGKCLRACPFDAIYVNKEAALKIKESCVLCGACVKICPEGALSIESRSERGEDRDTDLWRGVFVVLQLDGCGEKQRIFPVSFELIGKGRTIADKLGTYLCVVILGPVNDRNLSLICRYPAGKIYRVGCEELTLFRSDIYAAVLAELVKEKKPEILLCGATSDGRSFFPRAAALLHTGLTADCTELTVDTARRMLLQTRPAFGGNVMATIECPHHRPQMATVRPNVLPAQKPGEVYGAQVIDWQPSECSLASAVEVVGKITEAAGSACVSESEVIVAGGRGTGGSSGFSKLYRLAGLLGGAVGASRAAVDSGWAPYSCQIGQSGRVVQPSLYIACGISGSVQHLVGMRGSGTVVAINSDPGAPIFEVADFGFVGDLNVIVPRLCRMIEESDNRESE